MAEPSPDAVAPPCVAADADAVGGAAAEREGNVATADAEGDGVDAEGDGNAGTLDPGTAGTAVVPVAAGGDEADAGALGDVVDAEGDVATGAED